MREADTVDHGERSAGDRLEESVEVGVVEQYHGVHVGEDGDLYEVLCALYIEL